MSPSPDRSDAAIARGTSAAPLPPSLPLPALSSLSNLIVSSKLAPSVGAPAAVTAMATATTTTTTTSTTISLTAVAPPLDPSFVPSLSPVHDAKVPRLPILSSSPDALLSLESATDTSFSTEAATKANVGRPYSFELDPLLGDVSLRPNPREQIASQGTSLDELAHLVRLSKYQERKRSNTRMRLQLSLVSTALSARLVRCGDLVHRSLTACFRNEDKASFAHMYNAVHNVRKSCDELRKYALLEPELEALHAAASLGSLDSPSGGSSCNICTPTNSKTNTSSSSSSMCSCSHFIRPASASTTAFLKDIPSDAQDAFLSLLTSLRNNPDYLATRLCSLSTSELAALVSFTRIMDPVDTVLPFYGRSSANRTGSSGRTPMPSNLAGSAARDGNYVQKLLSFQRHDPLAALVHTCFANSAGPDSAEDQRRTNIWATACGRLITEKGAAGEPVLIAVLNAWSSMRDWAGRSNMEWFLMKILEDGAFLLDRAEDQNGTRFNLNEWTVKDQRAAEEFYERAIADLFDIIDDEDQTGIPDGLLELGNLILRKLDHRFVENTRSWLVYKWLFGHWLLGVIIHPETYGLMAEYHITAYGRHKILKEVALRAQKFVFDVTVSMGRSKHAQPASVPPAIRGHIHNILNRFRGSEARRSLARLLPARSVASLRETAEVHPFLVISPADLVTLVNTLFPDSRPGSAYSGGVRSGPGSVSGSSAMSQPIVFSAQRGNTADSNSILSTSISSEQSETAASIEPFFDDQRASTSSVRNSPSPSPPSTQEQGRANNYEDDGERLRIAVQDMVGALGRDAVFGSCHPCAERWAVVFISPDGNHLSTKMASDPDDDAEEDGNSSSVETDEEDPEDQPVGLDKADFDTDFHQLRKAILRLVEEYEIPRNLEKEVGMSRTFSNRADRLKMHHLRRDDSTTAEALEHQSSPPHEQSRNPYWRHMETARGGESMDLHKLKQRASVEIDRTVADSDEGTESVLITMLNAASTQSRAQSDFLSAHLYWKTIQQLNAFTPDSLRQNGFAALLSILSRGPRDAIRRSAAAVGEYEAWLIWLKQSQERAEGLIETMITKRLRRLRDKMWYITDVRNSAPYEFTRNIAVALKTMGTSRKWHAYQRARQNLPRGPAASYLYRAENEIVELLAAAENEGGPNKLSDDQAEKTLRWLQQGGIENFCLGEERIHRFCCEIKNCVSKLIGESIVDAPVLWSSDLYARDLRFLELRSKAGRDRDNGSLFWDDACSIASMGDSDSRRFNVSSRSGFAMGGSSTGSSVQGKFSQLPLDPSRFSFSKMSSSSSDVFDAQDYFSGGPISPVLTIDSTSTFWSPFLSSASTATSRAQSPAASTANLSSPFSQVNLNGRRSHDTRHGGSSQQAPLDYSTGRPSTSASSMDTVFWQRITDEKATFLNDLRQSLTSFLLSDLGNLVFARGSETDSWFGELGQQCINKREVVEKIRQQASATAHRHISNHSSPTRGEAENGELKPESVGLHDSPEETRAGNGISIRNKVSVNDANGTRNVSLPHGGRRKENTKEDTQRSHLATQSAETSGQSTRAKLPRQDMASSAAGDAASKVKSGSKSKSGAAEFPFTKAYRQLLRMFCANPSPSAKLGALFELENLILASLSSRSMRRRVSAMARPDLAPVVPHPTTADMPREDPLDNVTASRSLPLEETIDNVMERRSNTLAATLSLTSAASAYRTDSGGKVDGRAGTAGGLSSKDAVSNVLQSLFRDPLIRPKTLFRDLQFISAFVAPEILDRTERGRCFWDAGLAALLLKKEVCSTMVEVADEVVGIYTKMHKSERTVVSPDMAGDGTYVSDMASATTLSPPTLATTYSLADAARMWTITAKEGNPTSQRELALFYLSNPELVERTTLPLSKPREVFKKAVMEKYGGSSSSSNRHYQHQPQGLSGRGSALPSGSSGSIRPGGTQTGEYDIRNDPALICVAIHWMEAAEQGGDQLARTFLGQNEMMKA